MMPDRRPTFHGSLTVKATNKTAVHKLSYILKRAIGCIGRSGALYLSVNFPFTH